MPRWLAHLMIVVGWLLTPLVAWGASFLGVWLGAAVGVRASGLGPMVLVPVVAGAATAFGALWLWVRLMRRLVYALAARF